MVIVVGITLIWQKAVAAIYTLSSYKKLYWHYLVDGQKIAKPPN